MKKSNAIIKSILFAIIILLFPVSSGALSVILSLDKIQSLYLQGCFMLASLFIPIIFILCVKWRWRDIGFTRLDIKSCKYALYFLPVLLIYIPAAIEGFSFRSIDYAIGNLFLYMLVGIAEETYFRGIIPYYLNKAFPQKKMMLYSTIIFGVGHIAIALSGSSLFEIVITVINAIIFGWLAIEIRVISKSIIPTIIMHFLSNFETKIVAMSGMSLLIAEGIRGCIMLFVAIWLLILINKKGLIKNIE